MRVLYIIPSINRSTILRTVESIQQNDLTATILIAAGGGAGDNRNVGLNMSTSESFDWIGFIDDDDYYSPDFKKELDSKFDIVIFKMNRAGRITPKHEIRKGSVGISYFIKGSLYKEHPYKFDNKHAQDWRFFENYYKLTTKVKITENVYYNAPIIGKSVRQSKL